VFDKYIPLFDVTQIFVPVIKVVGLVGKDTEKGNVIGITDSSPGLYPPLVVVFCASNVSPLLPSIFAVARLFVTEYGIPLREVVIVYTVELTGVMLIGASPRNALTNAVSTALVVNPVTAELNVAVKSTLVLTVASIQLGPVNVTVGTIATGAAVVVVVVVPGAAVVVVRDLP
jgi:hypothetical protein